MDTTVPTKFLPILKQEDFEEFKDIIHLSKEQKKLFIQSPNPQETMQEFFREFRYIEAAGGIIQHDSTKEFLFIFRNGKWDIPKGKIEEGESPETAAIREIQEECGIHSLAIIKSLSPTYHVYHAYQDYWFKKTHWFLLTTNSNTTKPQQEEGITKVEWFSGKNLETIKKNTYASILEVINELKTTSN